jgi:hypothetical protein
VDADLLLGRVPKYKPPYWMLLFKTRSKLRDNEMSALRRLARSKAPHFALGTSHVQFCIPSVSTLDNDILKLKAGRNREHQGLAAAIVKM